MTNMFHGNLDDAYVGRYPHCDSRVLHHPAMCEFCAMPEFAQLHESRRARGINYTGCRTPGLKVCPSEDERPIDVIERWQGNRPKPPAPTNPAHDGALRKLSERLKVLRAAEEKLAKIEVAARKANESAGLVIDTSSENFVEVVLGKLRLRAEADAMLLVQIDKALHPEDESLDGYAVTVDKVLDDVKRTVDTSDRRGKRLAKAIALIVAVSKSLHENLPEVVR